MNQRERVLGIVCAAAFLTASLYAAPVFSESADKRDWVTAGERKESTKEEIARRDKIFAARAKDLAEANKLSKIERVEYKSLLCSCYNMGLHIDIDDAALKEFANDAARNIIEGRLRAVGLYRKDLHKSISYLHLRLFVIPLEDNFFVYGMAFSFKKLTYDSFSESYYRPEVWGKSAFGIQEKGTNGEPLNRIRQWTEEFVTKYLRANHYTCEVKRNFEARRNMAKKK